MHRQFAALRRRAVALVVVVAALGLVFTTGTASAAADPNPQTSGCAASMSRQVSADIYDGSQRVATAHLRYSRSCGSQWVSVYFLPGYSAAPSVWLQNQSGTDLYTAYSDSTSAYTYQHFNMANRVGCGGTHLYRNGTHLGWTYLGCF
ncbi:DUF2690 domain-containing protein [Lentzea sp. NPDC042327]|uniref:DUF2690 domain-containing protein n=1 Tax=Lentzea sp. NPDC042327 TaxID=3154801 RepID=UPI0033D66893